LERVGYGGWRSWRSADAMGRALAAERVRTMKKREKKKVDERIEADVRALRDDLRQMGADLIATLWSRRSRRRVEVPAGGAAVVTEVREELEPAGEYEERPRRRFRILAIRRPSVSLRALAVFFALGTVTALFLLRRRKVYVAEVTPPGSWRSRLGLRWPRLVSRRTTIETERYEPAGRET
jgi:hypothetical protein